MSRSTMLCDDTLLLAARCAGLPGLALFALRAAFTCPNFKRALPVRFDWGNQFDVIDEILNTRNIFNCRCRWEHQLGSGVAAESNYTVLHLCGDRSETKAAKFAYAISDQILDLLA